MILKYKISPLSYFSFDNYEMTLTNSESKKIIKVDNTLLNLLTAINNFKSLEDIESYAINSLYMEQSNFIEILNYLINQRFLISNNDPLIYYYNLWNKFGWENSMIYHSYTYDYPVLDYSSKEAFKRDQITMENYLSEEIEPPIYKHVDGKVFSLPPANKESGFKYNEINAQNRSLNSKLTLQKLSDLLYYTYGQIGSLKFPVTQELLRRTSPSGGARHPSECYVAILDSNLYPKGIYHYSVKNHSLILIREGDFKNDLYEYCYGINEYQKEVQAVFLHTSIFSRNWFRYREPKTYKVIYYDFGHILFNFKLMTRALKLSNYTIGSGLSDTNLEQMLKIDGFKEGILYFTAV